MENKLEILVRDRIKINDEYKVDILNNSFTSNLDDWTVGSGWSWSNGGARGEYGTSSSISQVLSTGSFVANTTYKVRVKSTFFITNANTVSTGQFTIQIGNVSTVVDINNAGTYVFYVTPTVVSTQTLTITQDSDFSGVIYLIEIDNDNTDNAFNRLDTTDDSIMSLTLARAEVSDINSRNGSFSKTFTLPNTNVNSKYFNQLHSLDIENTEIYFNKRLDCQIYFNDRLVIGGELKLEKVIRNDNSRVVGYEVSVTSSIVQFFNQLDDYYMSGNIDPENDIDFSKYDHIYTLNNLKKTWFTYTFPDPTIGEGYYYPIINYNNLQSALEMSIRDFKPALYVKEIIDKMFEDAGFTYTSNFFNTEQFKRLIIPHTDSFLISDEELESRKFRAGYATDINFDNAGYPRDFLSSDERRSNGNYFTGLNTVRALINDDTSFDFFDYGGNFNTSNHSYIIPNKGLYKFNFTSQFQWFIREKGGVSGLILPVSNTVNYQTPTFTLTAKINATRNGVNKVIGEEKYEILVQGGKVLFNSVGNIVFTSTYQRVTVTTPEAQLLEGGDQVYVTLHLDARTLGWKNTAGNTVISPNIGVNFYRSDVNDVGLPSTIFSVEPMADALFEGDIVRMNNTLPNNVTKRDFFKSIVTMFNLILDEDKNNINNIIIEPREDYFTLYGEQKDWTGKLDRLNDIDIERIPTLIEKNANFLYQPDNDDYNQDYIDNYIDSYGDYIIFNDEKTTDNYDISVIFSQTPCAELPDGYGVIVPQLLETDDNGEVESRGFNIRILYRTDTDAVPGRYLNFTVKDDVNGNYASFPIVASASHFDDPYNPTLDLNWGYQKRYYQDFTSPNGLVWNNLYNKYWRRYIEQIIDLDSRLVTATFKINESDISTFSFADKIVVDEQFYIVNQIIDWNGNDLTTVELLKLTEINLPSELTYTTDINNTTAGNVSNITTRRAIVLDNTEEQASATNNVYRTEYRPVGSSSTDIVLTGETTYTASTENVPTITTRRTRGFVTGDNNGVNVQDVILNGDGNIIDGEIISVNGSDNYVETNSREVTIIGSNNTTTSVTGVNIIGSNTYSNIDNSTFINSTNNFLGNTQFIIHVISNEDNPFNAIKNIDVIASGVDEVRPAFRSSDSTFVVNPSANPYYPFTDEEN